MAEERNISFQETERDFAEERGGLGGMTRRSENRGDNRDVWRRGTSREIEVLRMRRAFHKKKV